MRKKHESWVFIIAMLEDERRETFCETLFISRLVSKSKKFRTKALPTFVILWINIQHICLNPRRFDQNKFRQSAAAHNIHVLDCMFTMTLI